MKGIIAGFVEVFECFGDFAESVMYVVACVVRHLHRMFFYNHVSGSFILVKPCLHFEGKF
jgi:hypothetical protein